MDSFRPNPALRKSPERRDEGAPERRRDAAAPTAVRRNAPRPPAARLLPYQFRWVKDDSPLKIAVKARQTGYSFAATLRAVLRCLKQPTTWVFLSKGERQSRLLMEKVAGHVRACGVAARALDERFFQGSSRKQLETRFPNGSVIYGLPANPDTARGYSGNVTLDEFAFHSDAEKIYTALFPTITRGYGLEIVSTPNGTQGKFYELAKAAGLADGFVPAPLAPLPGGEGRERFNSYPLPGGEGRERFNSYPLPGGEGVPPGAGRVRGWSPHRTDIYEAVRQGLHVDLKLLRAGCEDESAWQQEFCCQFVSTAENFFPPELLAACLRAEASLLAPASLLASAHGVLEKGENRNSKMENRGPNFEFPVSRIPPASSSSALTSAGGTTGRFSGWMKSRGQGPGVRCQGTNLFPLRPLTPGP